MKESVEFRKFFSQSKHSLAVSSLTTLTVHCSPSLFRHNSLIYFFHSHLYTSSDFNIIDVSSVMARIENSKESMRNSTIATQDGSAEYQRVELTPSNWAWLAQQKALSTIIPDVTVDSLTMEISSCQVKLAHLYSKQIYAVCCSADFKSSMIGSLFTDTP